MKAKALTVIELAAIIFITGILVATLLPKLLNSKGAEENEILEFTKKTIEASIDVINKQSKIEGTSKQPSATVQTGFGSPVEIAYGHPLTYQNKENNKPKGYWQKVTNTPLSDIDMNILNDGSLAIYPKGDGPRISARQPCALIYREASKSRAANIHLLPCK